MVILTSNASKQLPSKALNLTVGEGHKVVALEEVEDALAKQVHDDANMSLVVEAIPQVYAPVPVMFVVGLQRRQYPKLDLRGVTIFLHRANDLDSDETVAPSVIAGLDHLAECALTEKLDHRICVLSVNLA
jgi:hypothetical protein